VPLGAALARGLEAAHEHELVHRDVKPANVLLGRDGSIKLTDFGISDLISALSEKPDVVFGTPGYLPPETIRGQGYDKSGDLFSLGAVLYYCLTGSRPFEGANAREAIRKTLAGRVKPPNLLNSTVPGPLSELVMSLLSPERDSRPADVAAVATALEEMARRDQLRWQPPEGAFGKAQRDDSSAGRFVPTVRLDDSDDRLG
jgi:serine/threonine protein kinase